jgi:acetyl-CoA carboxylase biotin carboxyl carrier protein
MSMKAKEIKELIDFIASSGLDEVNIETDEFKLHIKKQSDPGAVKYGEQSVGPKPAPQAAIPAAPVSPQPVAPLPSTPAADASDRYVVIKSPMIGTFYRSPGPGADPFVNVGDQVSNGKVVCIIEAMKLFNEIESEVSGKIVKILVENSSPVEYDQPLFLVDPA